VPAPPADDVEAREYELLSFHHASRKTPRDAHR
jgi:hypothetical protein